MTLPPASRPACPRPRTRLGVDRRRPCPLPDGSSQQRTDAERNRRRRASKRRLTDARQDRVTVGEPADCEADGEQGNSRRGDAQGESHATAAQQQERQEGHDGTDREGGHRAKAGRNGRTHRLGRKPNFLANKRIDRSLRVLHDPFDNEVRLGARETLGQIYLAEYLALLLRSVVKLMALEVDLVVEHLSL